MQLFHLRGVRLALTLLILVGALAFALQPQEPPVRSFRVLLGVNDKMPTDWNGKVEVTGGDVVRLDGWRFEGNDQVTGTTAWSCKTHDYIGFGKRTPVQQADGSPHFKEQDQPWPNGLILAVKGNDPKVVIKLAKGEVKFDAAQLKTGVPFTALGGSVRIESVPLTSVVRGTAAKGKKATATVEDDYPAFWVHYKSGKHYLAWLAYQNAKDRVLLSEARDGPDGKWSQPREVSPDGYHFRVALATTHGGLLWIVWSEMTGKNWDLYARPLKDAKLGDTVRLTDDAGPDVWHRMTTDNKGRAWLVWQGFRKGRSHIFARCAEGDKWHEPIVVSDATQEAFAGNAWDPTIAADSTSDRVWIGWDVYHKDTYQVAFASIENGPDPAKCKLSAPSLIDPCPMFQAHVSFACDRSGRLWAAWDESGPQWGKDTGFLFGGASRTNTTRLYASRSIAIKVLDKGKWLEPEADFAGCLPPDMREYNELPQLQNDSEGRMWLAFRHRTCRRPREDGWATQGRWDIFTTAYLGDRWTAPMELLQSGGRNDMRTSSQRDQAGSVYFGFATDNRGWQPPGMGPKNHQVGVSRLHGAPEPGAMRLVARSRDLPKIPECHPEEAAQVRRIKDYTIAHAGHRYHIYRGDFHRHTDISGDGMGDGSLMDLHRYGIDAAGFDFGHVSDHNMGGDNEYCWWRTQQSNDIYTVPGSFISMYGYERSVPYPQGHRNVIWSQRGHRTLPIPKPVAGARAADTAKLYAYLKETGGICTSHTSATDQGTDWADAHDPNLEPFVELFQGYHTGYEAPGAPMAITDKSDRIHGTYRPAGFVSKALDKGYKLGFQASSDHISTHVSYACILAEEFSREGLMAAMKKRHTYAATDNIIVDFRCGAAIMGDEVQSARPKFEVIVLGAGALTSVEILRNGEVIYTAKPAAAKPAEVRLEWQDLTPPARDQANYYYVRVIQQGGQMAWSSPIWVRK